MNKKYKNTKYIILLFILSLILIQCNISSLMSVSLEVPKSSSTLSIYGPDPISKIPTITPSSDYVPTIDELFNGDYAYLGTVNRRHTILVFTKQNGVPTIYASSIDSLYSQPVYKIYNNRTLLPSYIKTNGNKVEGISINPVFYKADCDNFMGTNFSFSDGGKLTFNYITNIVRGRYPLKRNLTSDIGNIISSNISVVDLENKIVNSGVWYSVEDINKTVPAGLATSTNYLFFKNHLVSITNAANSPSPSATNKYKGWNIWQVEPMGENYNESYIYVYDYVELTLEKFGSDTVMFLFNSPQVPPKSAWATFIRLSTKP